MKKIICKNCGYTDDVEFVLFLICPNCQHTLDVYDDNEDNEIANTLAREEDILTDDEVAHRICIASMEQNLETLGHRKSWDIIEGFADPKQRIVYRQLFFEAGGKI